jgi:hypothetical protein
VSAVLGTVLPGKGSILVNQVINFTKPRNLIFKLLINTFSTLTTIISNMVFINTVYIGEKVSAEITIIDIKKRFIDCQYVCTTDDGKVNQLIN